MGLNSDEKSITQIQAILRIAHGLREASAGLSKPHDSTSISSPAIIDINLPKPWPLLSSLLDTGVSHELASAANNVYQSRAEELRQHTHKSIAAACHKIAQVPHASASPPEVLASKVVSTFTRAYVRRLEHWREEIALFVNQASKPPVKTTSKNSRAFHHEYVPLLEHFFEENPFPTHADKVFLAKKSNMEYRQIHVWFQNRRNRTKKDTKPLRKKPMSEGATIPLDKLYDRMKGYMVHANSSTRGRTPPQECTSKGEIESQTTPNSNRRDVFVSPAPPHAFPSLYPPSCPYEPFPCKIGATSFGESRWRRVPVSRGTCPRSTSIDIDELVERFSQLNVRGESHPKGLHDPRSHAATVAITVIPSRAPHPSLVYCKKPHRIPTVTPFLSVPASTARLRPFQSPSPTSKPTTLVPLAEPVTSANSHVKRKTAPLPRRFPSRMREIHRDATPAMSESSTTSPSVSPRVFSWDSDTRSCSFSSASSLLSSPPNVTATIGSLPFGSPCRSPFEVPADPFGFMFGDMLPTPLSSVS
ncbi:hypothetical protein PAXINDRAFT_18716 [Paxillus involutus ATCC 200175]|uniref:Homeobox domain-containing protein n=1 Tax=Paxillus involutus ATCC 200175 TaxID=664439 RepID=A0A0C9TLD5_PAXIN|nr:hypothetical protein PAXINDRAFT_18716 [Paxillus involutus ATCC 200175]